MDLDDILKRLDSGASSVGTLMGEILTYRNMYAEPNIEGKLDDATIDQLDRRNKLGHQLEDLLEGIRLETDKVKVVKRGTILTTAASLLGRESEIAANYQAGDYLIQLEHCESAESFIDRAYTLFKETDKYKKQIPLNLIFAKLRCLENGHDDQATVDYVRDLLNDYQSDDFLNIHALLYRVLASAYLNQGKFDLALEASQCGLKVADHSPDELINQHKASLLATIGQAARSSGRYQDAITAFEACRKLAQTTNAKRAAATALSEIAITWFQLGEEERARKILEQAAQEAEQAGFQNDAARWRTTVPANTEPTDEDSTIQILVWAAALLREDPLRTDEALRLVLLSLERAQKEGDWRTELDARNCLVSAYVHLRNYSRAIAAGRQAVRGATKYNDISRELLFRTNLAKCYYDADRIEDAEHEVRIAVEKGKVARAAASSTEIRQAISAGMRPAYEVLAGILAQEWHEADGGIIETRVDKLLEVLQETRAGNLAGWVAVDNVISKKALTGLTEPLLKLRAANVKIEMEMLARVTELTGLLEEQEQARQLFTTATTDCGINVTIDPPIYSAKELQQSMRTGECLVDLYGLLSNVLVTVLKADGEPQRFLFRWNESDRSDFLKQWRASIALNTALDGKGKRLRQSLGEPITKEAPAQLPNVEIPLSKLLEQFKTNFVEPLVNALGPTAPSRLIIIPHRELALLPFSVISEYFHGLSISIVPGANVNKLIAERIRSTAGPRLAIADATKTLDYAAIEVANLPGFETLAPNVDAIVRDLGRANILHCAGHGMFDDQNPYLSGVIAQRFAGPQPRPFGARTPRFNEELLTVAEVLARTRLPDCYLVTLSACSTGIPRQHAANEFIGLPTAFLIAGAKNVVGSLWPVDDAATCLLMREFYTNLVRDGVVVSTPSTSLAFARDRLSKLRRSEIVEILGKDSDIIPELEFPYAGPEYTLAFQHYGVD